VGVEGKEENGASRAMTTKHHSRPGYFIRVAFEVAGDTSTKDSRRLNRPRYSTATHVGNSSWPCCCCAVVFNQDAVELCLKRQKNGEVHH